MVEHYGCGRGGPAVAAAPAEPTGLRAGIRGSREGRDPRLHKHTHDQPRAGATPDFPQRGWEWRRRRYCRGGAAAVGGRRRPTHGSQRGGRAVGAVHVRGAPKSEAECSVDSGTAGWEAGAEPQLGSPWRRRQQKSRRRPHRAIARPSPPVAGTAGDRHRNVLVPHPEGAPDPRVQHHPVGFDVPPPVTGTPAPRSHLLHRPLQGQHIDTGGRGLAELRRELAQLLDRKPE